MGLDDDFPTRYVNGEVLRIELIERGEEAELIKDAYSFSREVGDAFVDAVSAVKLHKPYQPTEILDEIVEASPEVQRKNKAVSKLGTMVLVDGGDSLPKYMSVVRPGSCSAEDIAWMQRNPGMEGV